MSLRIWDPYSVLNIIDRNSNLATCVSKTKFNKRCRWDISDANIREIRMILDEMETKRPKYAKNRLRKLAELSLCNDYHRGQASQVMEAWEDTIDDAEANFANDSQTIDDLKLKLRERKNKIAQQSKNLELAAKNEDVLHSKVEQQRSQLARQGRDLDQAMQKLEGSLIGMEKLGAEESIARKKSDNLEHDLVQAAARQASLGDANSGLQPGTINGSVNTEFHHHAPTERPETPQPYPSVVIPFSRDTDFVERGIILDQLHQKCAVLGSRTALVGLGGVGKSQLAIEYAYRSRDLSPETWVFWVHASNAARFEQSFRDIANCIKLSGRQNPKANIFQLVRDWLRDDGNGKWLLVLDNADDAYRLLETHTMGGAVPVSESHDNSAKALWEYLPQTHHGSVLVTTRSRSVALKLVEEGDIVNVEPMDEAQAVTLVKRKLFIDSAPEDIVELVAVLGYMPVAVVLAAVYVNQRAPRCSVRQYIEKFKKSDRNKTNLLSHEAGHLRRDYDAENSVIATWQMSSDYIQQERPSAANLLSLMSFFDQQEISEGLLREISGTGSKLGKPDDNSDGRNEEDNGSDTSVTNEFEDDISTLRNHSFNTFAEVPGGQFSTLGDLSDLTETATALSRDSGYASMKSKQQERKFDKSDTRSIASLESFITFSSSLNPAAVGGAAEELAEILLKNEEILQYVRRGFVVMDSDRFERNLNQFLKSYASELRAEADTHIQKSATRIVYSYRAYITRIIRSRVIGVDEDNSHATAFDNIKKQTTTKLILERFLAQKQTTETSDKVDRRPEDEPESDGNSHSDNEEPYLPNLEKLTDFLVLSTAFQNLKTRLEAFVQSNSQLQQKLVDSSLHGSDPDEHVRMERLEDLGFLQWIKTVFQRSLRPPIPSGSQRIEWICDCGNLLHMDFNRNSAGNSSTMNALLCLQSATLQASGSSHAPGRPPSGALSMPMQTRSGGNTSQDLATKLGPVSGLHSSNTSLTSLGATATASTTLTPANPIFLELCVNAGKLLKSLGEIDVSSISTDGDFFSTVKAHYLRLRSFRARFWLLKPVTVSYVRFSVEDRCRVGILHKPVALPPKTEVDAGRYHYDPCPLENELPISSDLFLHYLFSCSSPSHNLIWLPRIPRKLDTSILASPTPASFGWGVHIDEGPDYLKIFLLNLVVLGISGVLALLWEFFRHDIQGAMGIAAWIVMLLNTLMAVFVAKWSQE